MMIAYKCIILLGYITLAFAKYECGTTPHPFPTSVKGNRISGGSVVTPNSVPYQARLLFEKSDRKLKGCGGSLIELKPGNGSQWVLTAAHCTYYAEYRRVFAPEKVEVIFGAHRPAETEKTQLTVGAKRIISHPRYDDRTLAYDISLVLLKEYVIYNNEIRSVCMPKAGEPIPLDVPCYVSGWGKTYHGGQGSDVLKIAEMNILKKEECRIPAEQHAIIFCAAGTSRSATCQGDSGGPLVCLINNKATLYGIVSAGPVMCGDLRQPGEFTRVPAMMEWIQESAQRVDSAVPAVSRFEPKPNEQKRDDNDKQQPSPSVSPSRVDDRQKDTTKDFMNIPSRDNVKDTNDYKGSDVFNLSTEKLFLLDQDSLILTRWYQILCLLVYTEKREPLTSYHLYQEVKVMLVDLVSMIQHSLFSLAFATYECGTTPHPFPTSVKGNRIAGGSVATPNSLPFQARLMLEKFGDKIKVCGGTLVEMKPGNGSQWILTAAHCTYYAEYRKNFDSEKVTVILGAHRPNEKEKTQVRVGAKRIISHPRYDNDLTLYDISIILLKEYVVYNNEIRPACLPKAGEPVPMDVPCYTSGWGLTYHGGKSSEVLKIAEMNILPKEECRIKPEHHPIIFCAYGASRSAACQGDSGGPLVCLINNKATLYGITSFGPPMCGDLRHSVKFVRVPSMMEWVKQTAQRVDSTVPAVSRFEPKPNEQKGDDDDKQQPSPSVSPSRVDDRQKDTTKDFMNIPSRDNVKDTNDYKGSDVFDSFHRDPFFSQSRFPDLDQMISDFMSPGFSGMNGGNFFSSSPSVFRETRTVNKLPSVSRSKSDVGRFGFRDPAFTFFR
ncbi:Transmembrane protease serine 9 [Trichinella papuae]|uniref:Transmembrane protease serine 9 n=2 Tax=Trichinella papuae TaxID=268474 RepID=A0A0V1M2G0_9BILA|nr:Transmembrane protease serine 9 [Trichinella papuae]